MLPFLFHLNIIHTFQVTVNCPRPHFCFKRSDRFCGRGAGGEGSSTCNRYRFTPDPGLERTGCPPSQKDSPRYLNKPSDLARHAEDVIGDEGPCRFGKLTASNQKPGGVGDGPWGATLVSARHAEQNGCTDIHVARANLLPGDARHVEPRL